MHFTIRGPISLSLADENVGFIIKRWRFHLPLLALINGNFSFESRLASGNCLKNFQIRIYV